MSSKRYLSAIFISMILALLLIPGMNTFAAEKEILPQAELDACFAGGFNMETQLTQTYTTEELNALDKALEAMNMNRHDMSFRKDYTEAHLAFPIILDMMKNPLHIAAYMDGFDKSVEFLLQKHQYSKSEYPSFETCAVPELIACAMLHPGIKDANAIHSDLYPDMPLVDGANFPKIFQDILPDFVWAQSLITDSLKVYTGDELQILRQNLPAVMIWHESVKSPYSDAEVERLKKITDEKKSDSYIDELASKLDLKKLYDAWNYLPNPYRLMDTLDIESFPKDKPLIFDTPYGRGALGTTGNDYYTGEFAFLIDPAGDDVYENCRLGSAYGVDNKYIGFFLDMAGNDKYFCSDVDITQGAAVIGIGAFYDMGGGKDIYFGGNIAQGASACGIATFLDDGGSDQYSVKSYGQGAAGYGLGVMVDRAPKLPEQTESPANLENAEIDEKTIENNRFDAWVMAQGFSRQWGVGFCHGSRGNDIYHAGGVYLHAPLFNDRYQSFSQGFSIGSREIDYAGGIAILLDDEGNDYYLGDIYNQGVGYWYAGGFVLDKLGNDHYEMSQYGQGSGIHLAVGGIMDNAGNDSYTMNSGLGQGGSHDFAASVMMDRGGNDKYMGATSSNGCGLTNSVGLFFDRSGDDMYGGDPTACTFGGGRPARDTGSIGVFVDTAGKDWYVGTNAHDNRLWTQTQYGAGLDFTPEPIVVEPTASAAPAETTDPRDSFMPPIINYEGEFTDAVFDELWEIAVRWEVGDNRIYTPKARERLIAFGKVIIPKIDENFDDTLGLAARAYEVILPALHKDYPEEVEQMLLKNLEIKDEARQRNALSLIGTLKLEKFGDKLVPLLDDEILRGSAITTLGAIGSKAGNERIRKFLAPDQPERMILMAVITLIKLDDHDLYNEMRVLLDHEYFTVREGIITIIAQHPDWYLSDVTRDLKRSDLNHRTRLSLLRIASQFAEFFPSRPLYDEVVKASQDSDWVTRAHAVEVFRFWMIYKGEEWNSMKEEIKTKMDEMKKTETDFHVLFVLNKE
jgi:hypothetical protein